MENELDVKKSNTDEQKAELANADMVKVDVRVIILIIVIGALLAFGFMYICGKDDARKNTLSVSSDMPATSNIELCYDNGEVSLDYGYYRLDSFYAFYPGEVIETFDTKVILLDRATGAATTIPTLSKPDTKVNKLYNGDKLKLERSVFNAMVEASAVDSSTSGLSIIIYYNNNEHDAYYYTGYAIKAGGVIEHE